MTRGILVGVASACTYAAYALLQKWIIRGGIGGAASGTLSYGLCLAIGVAVLAANGRLGELRRAWREGWRLLLAIGLVGIVAIMNAPIGLQYASAGALGVLQRLDVAFSLAIGRLFLGERLSRWSGAGLGLMLTGTVVMTRAGAFSGEPREWVGHLIFTAGALGLAVNAFLVKRALLRWREDLVFTANLMVVITASTGLTAGLGQLGDAARLAAWPAGLAATLVSGVLLFFGFWLYYRSLRALPMWLARLVQLAFPVAVLLGGWLLFGERPGARQWMGIAAILAGFGCVVRDLTGRTPSPPTPLPRCGRGEHVATGSPSPLVGEGVGG